jgi:peroxiredoxin Q/BCP
MKLPLLGLSAISLFAFTGRAEPLTVGTPAPVITAKDQDGQAVNFEDVYSKGTTLVYFYPKAGVQSQKRFKDENQLPFTLIGDSDGKVAEAFGVPITMGLAKRQSFIVKEGKIAWVSPQAKTKEHAQEVQAALESLN